MIKYIDEVKKPKIIEQGNYHAIDTIAIIYWSEYVMGDTNSTVCIWRIKYKK